MPSGLRRDEVNALTVRIRRLLLEQETGTIETERARHEVEQIIAEAAGQLGDMERRDVARFAEQILCAVSSGQWSIAEACTKIEQVISAAADNNPGFLDLLRLP
jgi:hypothetical protein